ncbi:hypothetical protein AA0473_0724 [Acetobacter orleanensis NRIC 0473]|nr:hypothetical protein AD949_03225 [Acetobacter orleanensis]PCD79574.1 hypothetical protein CO710_04955 [Acetobacter orleanensis]GBR24772.1 hypothetical protein AA0473_0724 [Acetobacter orleanensis NRIC 0473]
MLLLASGRREGIGCFQGTRDSFGAALAPQLAFLLVGVFQAVLQPDKALGFTKLLLSLCVVLLPAVVSQFYAHKWGRDALWLRYITAATWCGWVVVLISVVATVLAGVLFPPLLHQAGFMASLMVTVSLYEMWLQWYVARVGLGLSRGRAALLYVSVLLATLVLYGLAALLPPHYVVMKDLLQPMISIKPSH